MRCAMSNRRKPIVLKYVASEFWSSELQACNYNILNLKRIGLEADSPSGCELA